MNTPPTQIHVELPQWLLNCRIIWGQANYDIKVQKEMWGTWWAYIQRREGRDYSSVALASKMDCETPEQAESDLLRKLDYMARSIEGRDLYDVVYTNNDEQESG